MGRSYRFRGGGGGGGNPEKIVCKSKKSPTKFFAGMKKIVCRKMTPEKMFSQTTIQKKNCFPWKNFHPPASKKVMVRPIDRQDTAAYSVF